nr:uncharacterized protein LOC113803493 [Penaeus vannamei]
MRKICRGVHQHGCPISPHNVASPDTSCYQPFSFCSPIPLLNSPTQPNSNTPIDTLPSPHTEPHVIPSPEPLKNPELNYSPTSPSPSNATTNQCYPNLPGQCLCGTASARPYRHKRAAHSSSAARRQNPLSRPRHSSSTEMSNKETQVTPTRNHTRNSKRRKK